MRCQCGHDKDEHDKRLPAPCAKGWNLALQVEVVEAATAAGTCALKALGEETSRQRATGEACPCIAFRPAPWEATTATATTTGAV